MSASQREPSPRSDTKARKKKAKRGPTPMMAQYLGIKAEHPDAILLFRMGDFYETFFDDAKTVSSLLGLTLTAREKQGDDPIPLAGVPHHALEHYLARLLEAGCTVAICEQTEDPAQAKGLVKREVVEVISPGTVTNPALLSSPDSVFLLALAPGDGVDWGYALLDGSTGEFRCGRAPADDATALPRRYRVGEVILPENPGDGAQAHLRRGALDGLHETRVSNLLFEAEFGASALCDHFGVRGLEGLGLADEPEATRAAGAALRYLADRQRSKPAQVISLSIDRPRERLHLDRETVAHLELFEGLRAGERETSLFHHLDATCTPMGRRRLAAWLRAPLCDTKAIDARLDAVAYLHDDAPRASAVQEALRGVGDLERIVGRIATRRVLPHELARLRDGLARGPRLAEALGDQAPALFAAYLAAAPELSRFAAPLAERLVEEPPSHLRQGGVFREGVDAELDRLRELNRGGKQWIARYQESERERTGISGLKVGFNKVFGYHVEVTNKHLDRVPPEYVEKQRLAGGKRFVTDELHAREQEILRAQDDMVAREAQLFEELVRACSEALAPVYAGLHALARVDALASLAVVARRRRYVRPQLDESSELDVREGRHPVVENIGDAPFVPNDLRMDRSQRQLLLLTGPNMGGKSTYLRQAALFVVMAQMGSFVAAEHARLGVVDRLFTRVGASDNLARGQSTFLVEMAETANILRNATDRSLVIFDEVGRGTSTQDGMALAQAITEYLHDGPVRPKTLFATHFHGLTELAERLARAANVQMQVKEWEGQILFLHKVVEGASDRSYGVHVAELAGVPRPVLERAAELLDAETPAGPATSAGPPARAKPQPQLALFAPTPAPILQRLRQIDPDELRPLDALRILADLVEEARDS